MTQAPSMKRFIGEHRVCWPFSAASQKRVLTQSDCTRSNKDGLTSSETLKGTQLFVSVIWIARKPSRNLVNKVKPARVLRCPCKNQRETEELPPEHLEKPSLTSLLRKNGSLIVVEKVSLYGAVR